MRKLDDVGSLFESLPPNMQDDYNYAFCKAVDKQIKKMLALAEKLKLWTDLDNADPKYYDYMAVTLSVPYYKSEYNNEKKLELIKGAIKARIYAGTFKGVSDFLSITFERFTLIPWYEYEGEPYHFKVRSSSERTPEIDKRFNDVLKRVKAARSVFDTIETIRDIDSSLYIGARYSGYRKAREIRPQSEERIARLMVGAGYTGIKRAGEINPANEERIARLIVGARYIGIKRSKEIVKED